MRRWRGWKRSQATVPVRVSCAVCRCTSEFTRRDLRTLPSTLAGRSGSPVCTRARVLQPSYADIHSEERCEKTSVDPVRRQPGRPRTTRDEARRV